MRYLGFIAALSAFVAVGAMAQTATPPAQNGPQNSAINSSDSTNRHISAPVKGHNSFTKGEAKSRIERRGFSNVSDLRKDENGIWRGRATKNGHEVSVSLDYQGNVIEGNSAESTNQTNVMPGNAGR